MAITHKAIIRYMLKYQAVGRPDYLLPPGVKESDSLRLKIARALKARDRKIRARRRR